MSAILHNGVIEHLWRSVDGADASITDHYVNIAWDGFYGGFFVSGVGTALYFFKDPTSLNN